MRISFSAIDWYAIFEGALYFAWVHGVSARLYCAYAALRFGLEIRFQVRRQPFFWRAQNLISTSDGNRVRCIYVNVWIAHTGRFESNGLAPLESRESPVCRVCFPGATASLQHCSSDSLKPGCTQAVTLHPYTLAFVFKTFNLFNLNCILSLLPSTCFLSYSTKPYRCLSPSQLSCLFWPRVQRYSIAHTLCTFFVMWSIRAIWLDQFFVSSRQPGQINK